MPSGYRVERWAEHHAPMPAMLRLTLDNEGYTVYQWVNGPGTYFGPHKHAEDQSHWVISGQLEINVQQVGVFQLGPGDRDFMPAETYHTAQVLGDEPVLYLVGEKVERPAIIERVVPKTKPATQKKSRKKPATKTKPAKKKTKK